MLREEIEKIVVEMQTHLLGISCDCEHCIKIRKSYVDRICEAIGKVAEGMHQYKIATPNPFRDSPQKKARNNAIAECQAYWQEETK